MGMAATQKLVLTTRELNTDNFKLLSHLPENPLALRARRGPRDFDPRPLT